MKELLQTLQESKETYQSICLVTAKQISLKYGEIIVSISEITNGISFYQINLFGGVTFPDGLNDLDIENLSHKKIEQYMGQIKKIGENSFNFNGSIFSNKTKTERQITSLCIKHDLQYEELFDVFQSIIFELPHYFVEEE